MHLASDRLYFTILIATGIHAVVLLGLNFSTSTPPAIAPPLALELLRGGDPKSIAGSQNPPQPSQTPAVRTQPSAAKSSPAIRPTDKEAGPQPEQKPSVPPSQQRPFTLDPSQVIQQIAALDDQRQQQLGDSRTRNLSNVGAPSSAESAYLAMWRRKCERIGANNYPPGRLQGELTMRVTIHHSGELLDVRVLRSSGYPVLDQAALTTVRQAAPYQPFNVDMRKRYDQLVFTRTWQFSQRATTINVN